MCSVSYLPKRCGCLPRIVATVTEEELPGNISEEAASLPSIFLGFAISKLPSLLDVEKSLKIFRSLN